MMEDYSSKRVKDPYVRSLEMQKSWIENVQYSFHKAQFTTHGLNHES